MKRFFKNSFFIVLILVSFVGSGIQVKPVSAQAQQEGMQIEPLNLPNGWSYGFLYGIWGSSADDVYAVGYGYNGSALRPLLYHKTGNNWTDVNLSLPIGWKSGYLYGIWGSGPNDVYAVGTGTNDLPLIQHWNGSVWIPSTPALPEGWTNGLLWSVWGSGVNDVYAVGFGFNVNTGSNMPLVFHWNGSNWTGTSAGLPSGPTVWTSGELYGVWGSDANNVYAIGSGNGNLLPLLYQWNGVQWTPSAINFTGDWTSGALRGIWGTAANDIYAVGSGKKGGADSFPMIQQWNGSSWTAVSSLPSLPTGMNSGYLSGVWGFASTNDIYAVGYGYISSSNTYLPLLYHRDATNWTESSPSLPIGWRSDYLRNVWGSASNDIYAVGSGHNGSVEMPLLYHSSQAGQDSVVPANVTNFAATSGASNGSIRLTWTAPVDDHNNPNSGPVTSYVVKYSDQSFSNWTNGAAVPSAVPAPTAPGTTQTMLVTGLNPGTRYYFAIRALDEQYNLSAQYAQADAIANVGDRLPGKVSLIGPSNNISTSQPSYTWNVNHDATWYYLWVNGPSGTVIQQWYTSAQANCNGTTCSVTPATTLSGGAHTWWVQTWNEAGYGPWSDAMNFSRLLPPLPGKATLSSPNGGIGTNSPTYSWNEVSGSTWYYLWVDGPSGNVIKKWYTSAQANCNGTTCSIANATPDLPGGSYVWWIQTWNDGGSGPWSNSMTFTAPTPAVPGKATLTAPNEAVGSNNPAYIWNEVSGSTWYYLWVDGPSGNIIKKWYTSAEANCNGNTCSVNNATPGLGAGSYQWWIQTWNVGGSGPWSDTMSFSITPPGKATLSAPSGSIGMNNPAYIWNEVSGSTWYYLWVDGPSGNIIKKWYTSAEANCNGTTCSITPSTALGSGVHKWWIQTWNDAGYGPWSDAMNFDTP